MVTKESRMTRCVGFLGCYYLCNKFARWLQQIVATVMRCVTISDSVRGRAGLTPEGELGLQTKDAICWFSGMLLSFVTTLQDDYKG
jgi:hypothetical protein